MASSLEKTEELGDTKTTPRNWIDDSFAVSWSTVLVKFIEDIFLRLFNDTVISSDCIVYNCEKFNE